MGRLRYTASHKIFTSKTFAKIVDDATFRNGTGGIMAIDCSQINCDIFGCNLKTNVVNNILYIDNIPIIDFTKEIVL